jgi:hypothetical protein
MKKFLMLCFCFSVVFTSVAAYSQRLETEIKVVRPDFSGKWKLNLQKSRWAHGRQPVGLSESDWFIIIEQKLPAIFITIRSQRGVSGDENFVRGNYTLFTDGRGDITAANAYTATTEWKDNKLITTYYITTSERKTTVAANQETELSADGNTLTMTWQHAATICGVNVGIIDETHSEKVVFDRSK